MSRGAREATFVESDRGAVRLLESSAAELGFSINTQVLRLDVLGKQLLSSLRLRERADIQCQSQPFDLLFLDPPFDLLRRESSRERIGETLVGLLESNEVSSEAIAVLRHPSEVEGGFQIEPFDSRRYGKSRISFFRHSKASSKKE